MLHDRAGLDGEEPPARAAAEPHGSRPTGLIHPVTVAPGAADLVGPASGDGPVLGGLLVGELLDELPVGYPLPPVLAGSLANG